MFFKGNTCNGYQDNFVLCFNLKICVLNFNYAHGTMYTDICLLETFFKYNFIYYLNLFDKYVKRSLGSLRGVEVVSACVYIYPGWLKYRCLTQANIDFARRLHLSGSKELPLCVDGADCGTFPAVLCKWTWNATCCFDANARPFSPNCLVSGAKSVSPASTIRHLGAGEEGVDS